MNKKILQHKLNVLHIYCRLKDKKVPNKLIYLICIIYEFMYKKTKILYKGEKNDRYKKFNRKRE